MAKSDLDPEFKRHKLELTRRLTSERRYEEAKKFMTAFRKQCKERGLGRELANKLAWEEMEKNFPPLSVEELEAAKESDVERPNRLYLPRGWPDIPEKGTLEGDAEWVYNNFGVVVQEVPGKQNRIRLGRAHSPAPSQGALSLLRWAVKNENAFFKDHYPKVRRKAVEDESDNVKRERKSISEIRRIIDQMENAT